MEKNKKFARESFATMTELVLPNDTNSLNNLMGGRMMHWMDIVSAIAAQRHSDNVVVTASVDNVSFQHPIQLGDVITLKAFVTRAFNTSMEVFIEVWAENIPGGKKFRSNSAFYTFVAVDKNGKPQRVPEVEPETEKEKELHANALRRRELRLVLSNRMKPEEAKELKSIFNLE